MHAPAIIRDLRPGPRAMLKHSEDPGRRPGRLAGGHIDDLAALRKAIWLCGGVQLSAAGAELTIGSCAHKFNAPAYGYGIKRNLPMVSGRCDGCGENFDRNVLFVPRSQNLLTGAP